MRSRNARYLLTYSQRIGSRLGDRISTQMSRNHILPVGDEDESAFNGELGWVIISGDVKFVFVVAVHVYKCKQL